LHLALLCAAFIAPYDPVAQNRELPYAPPTRLHLHDAAGWHLRPFVYRWTLGDEGYLEDKSESFPVHLLTTGSSYAFLGIFDTTRHLFGVAPPASIALFGTDGFGRDEFSAYSTADKSQLPPESQLRLSHCWQARSSA